MTPAKWLEVQYPDALDNSLLAEELAELLGTESNLLDALLVKASRLGLHKSDEALKRINQRRGAMRRVPESPYLHIFEDWPTAQWDSFMVTTDWHVPYYDAEMAERMMLVAQNWKPEPIKNLINGGDFIDYSQLGVFLPEYEEPRRALEDDLELAGDLLRWLTGWFDNIIGLEANHERRLARSLKNEISHEKWGQLYSSGLKEVHLSKWSYCVITDSTGAQWRITHPGRRWKNLGRLAQELANRYQMHILLAHSHVMSVSYNISGDYICVDTGGMFAEKAMGYYMKQDAAYWRWQSGFLVVSNGKLHTFNNIWTDWEAYSDWLGVDLRG
jgi:hypothetical protein